MNTPQRAHFVLVHGAWSNRQCWDLLARRLKKQGHDVTALDLPGHGADPTPPETVSLRDYADAVIRALETGPPAILVGHSMGGMVISAVAERRPDLIRRLVYVCAFLPRDGDSLLDLIKRAGPTVARALIPGHVPGTTRLNPDKALPYLCQDGSPALQQQIAKTLNIQPNAPQTTAVALSRDRFGSVARAYVYCTIDRTIPLDLQEWMVAQSPCQHSWSLDSGHLPQLTQPDALAAVLVDAAMA